MSDLGERRRRTRHALLLGALGLAVMIGVPVIVGAVSPGLPEGLPQAVDPTPPPTPTPTSAKPAAPPTASTPAPPAIDAPTPEPVQGRRVVLIDQPGAITPGVTAAISTIESVDGEASVPGEIAGPAVRFDVTITNGTRAAVPLTNTIVNVYYGTERTPAIQLAEPGGAPLPADVSPGGIAGGTYVFAIPADRRELVRITLDYSVQVQPLTFEGPIPR